MWISQGRKRAVKALFSAARREAESAVPWLSYFSLSYPSTRKPEQRLHALTPEPWDLGLMRLKADDAIWEREDVKWHWSWPINAERFRLRPRNKTKFWLA